MEDVAEYLAADAGRFNPSVRLNWPVRRRVAGGTR
jgi:hypothetical protein